MNFEFALAAWDEPRRVPFLDVLVDAASRVFAMSSREDERVGSDDRQDVSAALNGDDEAFERLVTKYQTTIAVQMQRFSRDQGVIEELVHDVFIEAYFSLKSFRSRSPLIHWLRKIAVRVGYRYWKRQARERKTTVSLSEIDDGLKRLENGMITEPSEASQILVILIERLSPRDRLVLTLLYWDGCSVEEAAKLSGWSKSMVKVQAHRARNRLKQLIKESKQ